jgi:hypothetical protein
LGADTYYWRVRAVNGCGAGPWSNPLRQFTIDPSLDPGAPAAVADLSASSGTAPGTVYLSWTAPGDDGAVGVAWRYVVRRDGSPITKSNWGSATDVDGEPAPGPAGSRESMTVRGLTPGKIYHFALKAQDEVPNTSAISNSPSAPAATMAKILLPLTARDAWLHGLPAPRLQPISNRNGDGAYTVAWSEVAGARTYRLQEATHPAFRGASAIYDGGHTSHEVTGRGAARYYYRVRAAGSQGDSAWSNVEWVDVLWEKEPNEDALTQANGPIACGQTYYGILAPGDEKDYFYLDLDSRRRIELTLSNISAGHDYDLYLRDENLHPPIGISDRRGNAEERIGPRDLPAGQYYVQIYNYSVTGSSQPYHLRLRCP